MAKVAAVMEEAAAGGDGGSRVGSGVERWVCPPQRERVGRAGGQQLGCGKERIPERRERKGSKRKMKMWLRELLDLLQCSFSLHFGEGGGGDRGTAKDSLNVYTSLQWKKAVS
jgi:hypothetical protein